MKLSFLLILLSLVLSGEPVNPKETKQQNNEPQRQQEEPAKQQNPTDKPFIIEQFSHSPPDRRTAKDQTPKQEAKAGQPTDSTWWLTLAIALFTGCLVGVGITQVAVYKKQAKYMRRGLKVTQQAAGAAEKSANIADKSLKLLQRARLIVTFDYQFGPQPDVIGWFQWSIKNAGNTLAMVKEIEITSDCWERDKIPDYEVRQIPQGDLPTIVSVYQNIPLDLFNSMSKPLSAEILHKIGPRATILAVYGWVIYDDIFGERHITQFCYYFEPTRHDGKGGFVFPRNPKPWQNHAT